MKVKKIDFYHKIKGLKLILIRGQPISFKKFFFIIEYLIKKSEAIKSRKQTALGLVRLHQGAAELLRGGVLTLLIP